MHDAHTTPAPHDDEAAAVVAALAAYLAEEDHVPGAAQAPVSAWQQSAKLQVQGRRAARTLRPLRWNTIERMRRMDHFGF